MRPLVLSIGVLAAACGRIGFDPNLVCAPAGATAVLPAGAVLHLEMESDPDGEIIDSTSAAHAVQCNGGCPERIDGKHGCGYAFSGQQLRVTDNGSFALGLGYTAAVWVWLDRYPTVLDAGMTNISTSYMCAFCKPQGLADGDSDSFCLCVNYDRRAYSYTTDGDSTDGATDFPLQQWHHLATTWDAGNGNKRVYVDGQQIVGVTAATVSDRNPLVIGADNLLPPSFFWSGKIDDVVLYERALSASEIQRLASP